MDPRISGSTFDQIFAFAPLVIGLVIYGGFYIAKRQETGEAGVPIGQTFACASCGRRDVREHMVPQEHDGAVCWYCAKCASKA
jgi:hypothetical protein